MRFQANMKSFLTRTFCLFMALQVLVASTGFATTEHWCAVKGKKTFLFTKPKSCCPFVQKQVSASSKPAIKRGKCCTNQLVFHKINTNAAQGSTVDWKVFTPVWAVLPVPTFGLPLTIAAVASFFVLHYYNPSPPLTGQQRLLFLQILLI